MLFGKCEASDLQFIIDAYTFVLIVFVEDY